MELEHKYNTVEILMVNDKLSKTIRFISKQNPRRRTKTKLSKDHRGRRRYGYLGRLENLGINR